MVDKADVETASILADELATILNRVAAEHDEVTVGSVAFAHWLALEQLLVNQEETEENDDERDDDDQAGGEESSHPATNGEGSQAQNTEGILLQSGEDQPATEVDPAFY